MANLDAIYHNMFFGDIYQIDCQPSSFEFKLTRFSTGFSCKLEERFYSESWCLLCVLSVAFIACYRDFHKIYNCALKIIRMGYIFNDYATIAYLGRTGYLLATHELFNRNLDNV